MPQIIQNESTATPAATEQRGGRFLSGTRQDPSLSPRQVAETEAQCQGRRTDRQPTSALLTPTPAELLATAIHWYLVEGQHEPNDTGHHIRNVMPNS